MHVVSHVTPSSAPGGFAWEDENAIVEVPDDLGTELLRIANQFSEVLPTDPRHPNYQKPEGDDGDEDLIGMEEPPRTGPMASKKAWQDYADSLGVAYPQGASRDAIIQAVDSRQNIAE